ncbi:MAG TPA: hypothetical protein VHO29_05890 [Marmoricola sp.]|nr:hypothetical protein [Marmoricola sp.]
MTRSLVWRTVVAAALLVTMVALPTPTASAGVTSQRAVITFDKFPDDPSASRITWQVLREGSDGSWKVVDQASWRAGSGMLGRAGRNECAKGRGWLPDGTYRLRYWRDYPGTLIKGRAFRLDDHRCHNGRRRVQLFIHTEQGAHDRQCRNRPGDQVCRWEFPKINDYKSAGCIKMAPGDLADLSRHFLRFYAAGVRYPKSRVVLRVVS